MLWALVVWIVLILVTSWIIARLVGIYLNYRYAKRFPTHKSYERLQPERRTDTVIFVHGLHGHFRDTWPRMPDLLHHDPDLPHVDVLLWGYRGSIFPGCADFRTWVRRSCPLRGI